MLASFLSWEKNLTLTIGGGPCCSMLLWCCIWETLLWAESANMFKIKAEILRVLTNTWTLDKAVSHLWPSKWLSYLHVCLTACPYLHQRSMSAFYLFGLWWMNGLFRLHGQAVNIHQLDWLVPNPCHNLIKKDDWEESSILPDSRHIHRNKLCRR